jgi:hypothetical protein
VDGGGVGEHDLVQLAEPIGHVPAVELDHHLRRLGIDAPDDAQVAVVDLLVVRVRNIRLWSSR